MQKPFVGDALSQDVQQGAVIEMIEETFDVTLDPPSCPGHFLNPLQGGMTTSPWAEAMRGIRKRRFIDGFEDELYHSLKQLVFKIGYPYRARSSIGFLDVGAADRCQCSPEVGPPMFGQYGPIPNVTLVKLQADRFLTIDTFHDHVVGSICTSFPELLGLCTRKLVPVMTTTWAL